MDGMGRRLRKGRALVREMLSTSGGASGIGDCDEDSALWSAFSGSFIDVSVAAAVEYGGVESDMTWSIRLRGYRVSGMRKSSRRNRTAKRRALNQLIHAELMRLKKPPTCLLSLVRFIFRISAYLHVGPSNRPESIARTHSPNFCPRS